MTEPVQPEAEAETEGQEYSLPPNQANVRAWAKQNGYQVGETGRLSDKVKAAFKDAHRI